MEPVTAPISSPLWVKQRKNRLWALDTDGQIVIDGRTRDPWPERYAGVTASGTHRVAAEVDTGSDKYLPVVDAGGREVARILKARRRPWVLQLNSGETAEVSERGAWRGARCTVGDLAKAAAPWMALRRGFRLTVADAIMARPDRDALLVALTWLTESVLAVQITSST
jgi:hypothetical protein